MLTAESYVFSKGVDLNLCISNLSLPSTAIGSEGIEAAIRGFHQMQVKGIDIDIFGAVFMWSEEPVHGGDNITFNGQFESHTVSQIPEWFVFS